MNSMPLVAFVPFCPIFFSQTFFKTHTHTHTHTPEPFYTNRTIERNRTKCAGIFKNSWRLRSPVTGPSAVATAHSPRSESATIALDLRWVCHICTCVFGFSAGLFTQGRPASQPGPPCSEGRLHVVDPAAVAVEVAVRDEGPEEPRGRVVVQPDRTLHAGTPARL